MTLFADFSATMTARFQQDYPEKIGVAVSGGGDSMAVMQLAARWARHHNVTVLAVTVDHGLRGESEAEAEFVGQTAQGLGVRHTVLNWSGWNGQGNLQDAARRARQTLIADWADRHDIDVVLTGHTADDQAETVLMRLARGSGVDGLAGMAADTGFWLRPVLDQTREQLRGYLQSENIAWVEDPSNDDPRFDRVKARQMLGQLAALGLTQARLVETANHMTAARDVLYAAVTTLADQAAHQDLGDVVIERALFEQAFTDTRLRLLAAALAWVSGQPYKPRLAPLRAIAEAGQGTLQGCQVLRDNNYLRVARETQAVRDEICASDKIWDGCWAFEGPHAPDLEIRVLDAKGLTNCPQWRDSERPRASLLATPAIWRGQTLVSAPLAGYANGWQAKLTRNRGDFAASLIRR